MHNSKQYSKPQGAGKPHGGGKSFGGAKSYGGKPHGDNSYGSKPRGDNPYGGKPHSDNPYGGGKPSRAGTSFVRGNAHGADEPRADGSPRDSKPQGGNPRDGKPFGGNKPFGAGRSYGNDTKPRGGKPRYSHTPRYARDNALAQPRTPRDNALAQARTPRDTHDTHDTRDIPDDTSAEPASESADNLVYGRNPVREYLNCGQSANVLYTAVGVGGLSDIIALARDRGIPVKEVSRDKLDRICGFNGMSGGGRNGGVVLEVASAQYVEISDILEIARSRNEPPFIIISDGITDPHNLGAVIRTALSAGAHGVVIPKRGGVSVTPAVAAASAGATAYLAVARVTNISETIELLKNEGVFVYGASAEGENYRRASLSGAVALVIGNEGDGLRRLTRERCDALIGIDMLGAVGSLNASVSAGVLMYEVVRARAGE
ncbi:hypothetical protein FACS1894133_0750 [Clostridia bacterium]|nr:hypothetical protein FACS1894133_0040 [Clostridia bacterium]GHU57580.1 hypothetical protein FACS1894133_0750 [Clostridia bacterium]